MHKKPNYLKASALINIMVSLTISLLVCEKLITLFLLLEKKFHLQKEKILNLDAISASIINLKNDFKNIVKLEHSKPTVICNGSVSHCLNKIPEKVINLIRQDKILVNSYIFTLHNVKNYIGNANLLIEDKNSQVKGCFINKKLTLYYKNKENAFVFINEKYEKIKIIKINNNCFSFINPIIATFLYNKNTNIENHKDKSINNFEIYEINNVTYYSAINEKSYYSLYRLAWGHRSDAIADKIIKFKASELCDSEKIKFTLQIYSKNYDLTNTDNHNNIIDKEINFTLFN